MNDDHSDLEQRLRRLFPAKVPGELQRKLHAAESPVHTASIRLRSPRFLAAWFRPWPLAYAGLGAAWAAILLLHLFTQAPPPADRYLPLAQSSDNRSTSTPATLTAGFSLERAFLLTRSNNSDSLWP